MSKTTTKVTINDVASTAKVSKKTVSRVINNEPGVSEKTRQKVQDVIAELNYSPDPQARGLASSRSFLLALIYDNPNAEFVTEAMYGVLDNCQPRGYELVVHPCIGADEINVSAILSFIRRIKIDGVILLPPLSESETLINALRSNAIHYVRLLSDDSEQAEHLVQFDDQQATRDVVQHLIQQGHQQIGFIKGSANSKSANRRYRAFCQAMHEASLRVQNEYVQQGNFTFQSGLSCAELLLNLNSPPTAILASNDEMALGVMAAANRHNILIPEHLALAGFDNTPHSSAVIPSLTTVNLKVRAMANLATEKLLLLCGGNKTQAAQLPFRVTSELIIRNSTSHTLDP